MVCCDGHRVNYQALQPCTVAPAIVETAAPRLSFVLESNTSPYSLTAYDGVASNFAPVPGDPLPGLSNGEVGFQLGLRVNCPGGIVNFANTVSIVGSFYQNDRQMIGIGNWSNWGNDLGDGDGLTYDSCEVYVGGSLVHTENPLIVSNGGQFHENLFAAPIIGPTSIRKRAGRKVFSGSVNANSREVAAVWAWEGTMSWNCRQTIRARIRSLNPFAGPLRQIGGVQDGGFTMTRGGLVTFAGGNLTQQNGPHQFDFDIPAGVVGTITTNQPGNFSRLTVDEANPSLVLSGNATQSFSVSWTFTRAGCRPGIMRDGSVYDAATGALIASPRLCGVA